MDPRPASLARPTISVPRKLLFYAGYFSCAAGVLLAVWSVSAILEPASYTPSGLGGIAMNCATAIGLWLLGLFVRRLGVRGLAGSGLVLDPARARTELEPWSRAAGGLVASALGEIQGPRDIIKVRCPACAVLNEESSRRCRACGGLMA